MTYEKKGTAHRETGISVGNHGLGVCPKGGGKKGGLNSLLGGKSDHSALPRGEGKEALAEKPLTGRERKGFGLRPYARCERGD